MVQKLIFLGLGFLERTKVLPDENQTILTLYRE